MAKQYRGVTTKRHKTTTTVFRKTKAGKRGKRIGNVRKLKNGKWAAYGKKRRLSGRVGRPAAKGGSQFKTKTGAINRVGRSRSIKR